MSYPVIAYKVTMMIMGKNKIVKNVSILVSHAILFINVVNVMIIKIEYLMNSNKHVIVKKVLKKIKRLNLANNVSNIVENVCKIVPPIL